MFCGIAQLILPEEIKRIESIKTESSGEEILSGSDSVSPPVTAAGRYTGCGGGFLWQPGRFRRCVPVIVDEQIYRAVIVLD
jgi:hypothetical protein